MGKDNPKLLLKINRLLRKGYNEKGIADLLTISRTRVRKIVTQLVETKRNGKQRISGLHKHHQMISRYLSQGKSQKYIKERLPDELRKINRSTLWRYIRKYCASPVHPGFTDLPGEMAYVSVTKLAHTEDIYLFSVLLGYSRYGYFCLFRLAEIHPFLVCHMQCFKYLSGVPRRIRLCEISCLHFSQKECRYYKRFLSHYGTTLEILKDPEKRANLCGDQLKTMKEQIVCHFFHADHKKLTKYLRQKYMVANNLTVHPRIGRPISLEFKQVEQSQLLPLPPEAFSMPVIALRKVSSRGRVYYCGHYYQLPVLYRGTQITLRHHDGIIRFLLSNRTILSCPYRK